MPRYFTKTEYPQKLMDEFSRNRTLISFTSMNAFFAKKICNCHVESAIIKIDNDEREFEIENLHEKTEK